MKIPFARLVWLVKESLPSQTSLSTTKKYYPRQDNIFAIKYYVVWGISENPLPQTSLARIRKSPFPDQSGKPLKTDPRQDIFDNNFLSSVGE